MKLEAKTIQGQYDRETRYYRAADVDALLARIRAAVEAERWSPSCLCLSYPCLAACPNGQASAALDALLADGGA